MMELPEELPEEGRGESEIIAEFEELIGIESTPLGTPLAFAHMDPPPPEVAVELTRLNARMNQNLLHPSLSPFATLAEERAIDWLCPFFGMHAGFMCGGSSLANLTALWCAREHGAVRVVASQDAHVSVRKSALLLGMDYESIRVDHEGRMDAALIKDVSEAAVVWTAGSTGRGAVDSMAGEAFRDAMWRHVDAAWGGPLRLTRFADRLAGIEGADSIAISAHKWLYQPKDSAIVLFADPKRLEPISFTSSYLARPNVGLQGSRGAVGVTLLATLMAWGRSGLAARIEKGVADADALAQHLFEDERTELLGWPMTGVVNWRPANADVEALASMLEGICSTVEVGGALWLRNVAANPNAQVSLIWGEIDKALQCRI